jgi:hypothetical protein
MATKSTAFGFYFLCLGAAHNFTVPFLNSHLTINYYLCDLGQVT